MNLSITKKDVLVAAIIGEAVAWLVILTVEGLRFNVQAVNLKVALPVLFPVLSVVGFYIAALIAKKIPVVLQLAKFSLVGALNTFVDLGVLNLLIIISNVAVGFTFLAFKGASFIVAVINSYFWNKFWTFKSQEAATAEPNKKTGVEFIQFLVVSVIGLFINVGIAGLVVNIVGPLGGLDIRVWANVGAIMATAAALIWNFLGYKYLVFKRR